jgi:hypothetical protein
MNSEKTLLLMTDAADICGISILTPTQVKRYGDIEVVLGIPKEVV